MRFRAALPPDRTNKSEQVAFDNSLREREIRVKERDVAIRQAELRLRMNEQKLSRWRNPLVVAIMAATVTAAANLAVTYVNNDKEAILAREKYEQANRVSKVEADLAREKYEQGKADEKEKRLATSAADFSSHLSRGYQRGAWLLWAVRKDPASVNSKMIAEYNSSMKEVLSQAIATHISIANQDRKLFFKLAPLLREMSTIDGRLTEALITYRRDLTLGRPIFDALHAKLELSSSLLGRSVSSAYLNVPMDDSAPPAQGIQTGRAFGCPGGVDRAGAAAPCPAAPTAQILPASSPWPGDLLRSAPK